ncbi:putative queuine/archaeosine tRNA-ribosyltransferase [Burkholderia thailandensis 34]|uniref:hypothetical protein n=1 Tax=Burkholderia thailandensis TaxID=57975 RepID=UPI0005DA62AC|nr:hypothetical protein [Burkholderia thailandensis]AJY32496.1 putative queuine/archaeosine tRNA-ribosyltransferase [Burkholderia thailandensis 34]AOJ58764.1 tRNA-ribosyltransferase [Burkholderia thailandensis]KXF57883.1 tRNA-ribosyltransferase [Burkholderia thailandensis]PNE77370.1 tRNA-ribosyltransferase [Burkholderia thailandensis]
MTEIGSYVPQFILRGKTRISQCQCESCRARSPLVTHAWTNHVRHSALLQCETVSREALFERDAFELHTIAADPGQDEALDAWQNGVNQACIYLLIEQQLSIPERLHAIGVLLSRVARAGEAERDPAMPIAVVEELIELAGHGVLQARVAQMPIIDLYKYAYLRRLARVRMCFDLDSASSMSLNLRLTELQVISDGFLADALREIERSPAVEKFFAKHDCTWQNYFLYRCFHEVFPGAEPELYDLAFLDMCLDYFCLRSLCAILVSCDVELDEDVVSSLFSAWQCNGKASLGRDDHTDPLLIGFTLIGEVHD